jgi:acyl-CoA hydrolase
VNWTGTSSMEVGVRLAAERWDAVGTEPLTVATAYLVFVAVDVAGHPRNVPPVVPEHMDDERRFREALIRREHRLARRAAILRARAEIPGAGPAPGAGSVPQAGSATGAGA